MIKCIVQLTVVALLICGGLSCGKGAETKKAAPNAEAQSPGPIPARQVATPTVIVPDDQIQAKVIELIADQTGQGAEAIKPTTHLHNDLKMDDLDDVRLVMQLEDTFGFPIPDDDAKRLSTVAAISDYVKFRRSAK